MFYPGMLAAYIGAVVRWVLSSKKRSIREYYLGKGTDDYSRHFTDAIINRIIGIISIIIFFFILGSILLWFDE